MPPIDNSLSTPNRQRFAGVARACCNNSLRASPSPSAKIHSQHSEFGGAPTGMVDTPTILDEAAVSPDLSQPLPPPASPTTPALLYRRLSELLTSVPGPQVRWSRATLAALLALFCSWAALFYATWARWGNLTVDSGHEMYVPTMLAAGKMLYRDVWFMYGPAAPYFNSYLFRLFGAHLSVLYWAGALAGLGSAIFLFLTGMSLGSWVIGWTAGVVVLIEAFEPGIFCFPLPYSFAAVYGCLTVCIFLWMIVQRMRSGRWTWMLGAGLAAAVAALLKLEFGLACYGALGFLVVVDSLRQRSWKPVWQAAVALLPGVLACVLVARWMVSIAGLDFITQENIMSWPTSYFMKAYGKMWLAHTGFDLRRAALVSAVGRVCAFACVALGIRLLLRRGRRGAMLLLAIGAAVVALNSLPPVLMVKGVVLLGQSTVPTILRGISILVALAITRHLSIGRKQDLSSLLLVLLGLGVAIAVSFSPVLILQATLALGRIAFPVDMVLIVGLAAIGWWLAHARNLSNGSFAIAVLFTFSFLLAFRILSGMQSEGYPIYYTGPVLLSLLFLELALTVPGLRSSASFALRAELIVCGCCLFWVITHAEVFNPRPDDLALLDTERGVIWAPKHLVNNYQTAIAFMKEKAAAGDSVLSVPEDTSLYFLSGAVCPTRVYQFTPGVLAPGKMTDDTINEIERKKVRYLLWSNRAFPEYGVPVFGADYDTMFAGYLRSHYRLLAPLIANNDHGWNAVVWERLPEPGL